MRWDGAGLPWPVSLPTSSLAVQVFLNPFLHSGPGFRVSDFESNSLIAQAQFLGAQSIMSGSLNPVSGTVRSVHVYLDMLVFAPSFSVLFGMIEVILIGPTILSLFRTEQLWEHALQPWVGLFLFHLECQSLPDSVRNRFFIRWWNDVRS